LSTRRAAALGRAAFAAAAVHLLCAMGQAPAPFEQAYDVYLRPAAGGTAFLLLRGRERRHPHHHAAQADATRWDRDLDALARRLATLPRGDWIVFQALDERWPAGSATTLRTALQRTCRELAQRCAFAF